MIDWVGVIGKGDRANARRAKRVGPLLPTGCREWQGARDSAGYGRVHTYAYAHRWAWIVCRGPIPSGLEIDHLCNNRACVEITHLELVTHADNQARAASRRNQGKTHCKHGHQFTAENTHVTPEGHRVCRACRRQHVRRWAERNPDKWHKIQQDSVDRRRNARNVGVLHQLA